MRRRSPSSMTWDRDELDQISRARRRGRSRRCEADLVVGLELVEASRSPPAWPGRASSGPSSVGGVAHRAGHVDHEQHPGRSCAARPSVEQARSSPGARAPEQGLRLVGSTPFSGVIGAPMATSGLPGRKLNSSTRSLVVGLLDEVLEALRRPSRSRLDPVGVEHEERVVREERALLRGRSPRAGRGAAGAPRRGRARRRGCRGCSR